MSGTIPALRRFAMVFPPPARTEGIFEEESPPDLYNPVDRFCGVHGNESGHTGVALPPLLISATGLTERGKKHEKLGEKNQDAVLVSLAQRLFAVADGIGGHPGGAVASQKAVELLEYFFDPQPELRAIGSYLESAFEDVSYSIYAEAQNTHLAGMGATLSALHFYAGQRRFCAAHVGDSRIYLVRQGTMTQLTRDQIIRKNVLSQSIGEESIYVDVLTGPVEAGDVFLICSDGLTKVVSDEDIRNIVSSQGHNEAANRLMSLVRQRNGADDATVVVLNAHAHGA